MSIVTRRLAPGPTAAAIGLGVLTGGTAWDANRPMPVIVIAFLFWPLFSVVGQLFGPGMNGSNS